QGNFIGTDLAGTVALGNGADGVLINFGSNNTIGGPVAAARNILSANQGSGVEIIGSTQPTVGGANNNVVQNNSIGVGIAGKALANGGNAINIPGSGATSLSGGVAAAGTLILSDVISANSGAGIQLSSLATNTLIQTDKLGTNSTGSSATDAAGKPLGNAVGVF